MEKKKKVAVTIGSKNYTIVTEEDETEIVLRIADYVNGVMEEIKERNPRLSVSDIHVLTCINIARELHKSLELNKSMDISEIEGKLNEAAEDKEVMENLLEETEKEIIILKDKLNVASNLSVELRDDIEEKKLELEEKDKKVSEFQERFLKSETELLLLKKELKELKASQGIM
ncbi:MAG: cell division protein ZapA [Tissierellia bacterium]|nr:cell division protein ZapA [Tissierellia bacterium]